MRRLKNAFSDEAFMGLVERFERQLAKLLSVLICIVLVAATVQLVVSVLSEFSNPASGWLGDDLIKILGDVLTLLIALEVLQNVTAYLRRHVVQIELVLITALTAVARKVIVLPPGAENKPMLLLGLGVTVVSLSA
ncbi:MAG: phosphate-starvation-inducible PsiE family protein, partial [Synechococcaceae cyanobacterium MAG-AL2]